MDDYMSDDEIIVKDTQQDSFSPKTFSKKIINRFGIKSQTRGTETVDSLSQTQSVLARLAKEVKANNKSFDACDIRGLHFKISFSYHDPCFTHLAAIRTYYRTKKQEKSLIERGLISKRNKDRRH